jgi:signal transduction histidine kinase
MNKVLRNLSRRYVSTLRRYLVDGREAVLAEAYELGRRGIASGLGVLDMARAHTQALEEIFWPALPWAAKQRALDFTETFLLESFSPFEATHRGFRETNRKLHHVIARLEKSNADLARINRRLAAEIRDRQRAEAALRQSESHYRRLFADAQAMQENLRHLSNKILHAQEEERKRISRELHDEVGQSLTAIGMKLAGLGTNGHSSARDFAGKIAATQDLVQQTMDTVHRFARELRPAMLDELGLLPALRSQINRFAERTGLRVRFRASSAVECLAGEQKTALYRIAQESLTNVAKHAQASRVEISIRKLAATIRMEIADNGKSFREKRSARPGTGQRLGLLGMQERVRLVNGAFSIRPQPGTGTTVLVTIPMNSAGTGALSKFHRNHRSTP